ncbi:MAG TPA: rod shape-determining protein MreD [Candidatus Doudnabacteria bacterium]|nr:rod shape-determining protein MreD [Candidatus Doudnabacteria bacterium]
MKWLIYISFILTVVVANQTIFRLFEFSYFVPDLLLLLSLAVVWSFNNYDYLIFGLLGGVWLEIFAGLPIGSISLGVILISSLAYMILNRWVFSEKPWQYFLGAVALGTLLIRVWIWLYTTFLANIELGSVAVGSSYVWQSLLPALSVNLLLIYPVFALIEFFAKYLQNFAKNKLQL